MIKGGVKMEENKKLEQEFLEYYNQLWWQEQEELLFKINKLRKLEE